MAPEAVTVGWVQVRLPRLPGELARQAVRIGTRTSDPGRWTTVPAGPVPLEMEIALTLPGLRLRGRVRTTVEVPPGGSVTVAAPDLPLWATGGSPASGGPPASGSASA